MNKEEIRKRLGFMAPQDFYRQRVLPRYERLQMELGQERCEEVVAGGVGSGKTTEMLLAAAEFLTTEKNDGKGVTIVAATTQLASDQARKLREMLERLGRPDAADRVKFCSARLIPPRAELESPNRAWFFDHFSPRNPKPMTQSPTPPPQRI